MVNGTRDCTRYLRSMIGELKCARARVWIGAGLLLAATLPAQTDWVRARLLEPRSRTAIVHDVARQRVVLFGGYPVPADTWEWDGASWVQRSPAASPPARRDHAMAYDAARQRVVLFAGQDNAAGRRGDTWDWDGGTWVQRNPGASPAPRWSHALTYDAARQRVILFGGQDNTNTSLADTWEWDGAN